MKNDDLLMYGAFALVGFLVYKVVSGAPATGASSATGHSTGGQASAAGDPTANTDSGGFDFGVSGGWDG